MTIHRRNTDSACNPDFMVQRDWTHRSVTTRQEIARREPALCRNLPDVLSFAALALADRRGIPVSEAIRAVVLVVGPLA